MSPKDQIPDLAGPRGRRRSGALPRARPLGSWARKTANLARSDEAAERRAGEAPGRGRRADRGGTGDDEGRGHEARPGHVVPRRRPRPRGVPRGVPAQARPSCATPPRRSASRTCARSSSPISRSRSRTSSTPSTRSPIAAASIGQVYRATLPGGRAVAVKVQYPGVGDAVRADMQNLGIILRLMKRVAPGLDVKAIGEEVRARIYEELDYELEAQNQRSMARIYRGHPFIVIPDVLTRLSRERVIVQRVRLRARVRGAQAPAPGRARPDRGDRVPLLLRLAVPPPPVLGRPAPGQLPAPRRRTHGLPRLRAVQAHERRGGRVRAHLPARLHRRRRRDPDAPVRRAGLHQRPQALHPRGADGADRRLRPGGGRATRPSPSTRASRRRSPSRCPTRAPATSTRCATSRCRPSTCSRGASRC